MTVTPLPHRGSVQFDRRDGDRIVRIAPHPELGFVTLSIWRDDICVGTHQMDTEGATQLIALLADAVGVMVVPAPLGPGRPAAAQPGG